MNIKLYCGDNGINFTYTNNGKFSGMVFAITGTFNNFTRDEMIKYIESNGGIIKSGVTKNINLTMVVRAKLISVKIF